MAEKKSHAYYLGCKHVVSKKTGQVFDFVRVLRKNRFGDWETMTYTCESEDDMNKVVQGVAVGDPVTTRRDDDEYLVALSVVQGVKRLEIS